MEQTMKIKGMVCRRCIETVKDIFHSQGLKVDTITLGEVTFQQDEHASLQKIPALLQAEGFEVLTDRQSLIINKVKELVESELINKENQSKNLASLISETLHMDYDSVSTLFSHTEGIKLEQYVINKRVDKVQELLKYTNKTLTDISFDLGYSSVHHLSNQFKKITGMSPSQFRELHAEVEK